MLAISARSLEHHADVVPREWPVVAVSGLAFEASIAAGTGVRVVKASDRRVLLPALREAVANGSQGIVSFGVAGGLDPDLVAGHCVIAATVLTDKGRFMTSRRWSQRLMQAFPGARRGDIVGVEGPVASPAEKQALHRDTGALAVDTESDLAARVAAVHGLPFVAIRIVVDSVHRPLPPAALVSTHSDGQLDLCSILASLARQPAQLPDLVRLAYDARAARSALVEGRQRLGSHLGLPGLDEPVVDRAPRDRRAGSVPSFPRAVATRRPELVSTL